MKYFTNIVFLVLTSGCTMLRIEQVDESAKERKITTTLKAVSWFSSTQTLAKLKATTTDKTQSIGTDSIGQQGSTNSVEALRQINRMLELLKP